MFKTMNQKYHFFFGHIGPIEKTCFSQWFMRDFIEHDMKYCCMEQYMMAKKALLFKDNKTWAKIMASRNPKTIKSLGRLVKNFDSKIWDKRDIVFKGNLAKFSQNLDLKEILLSTGNKILVEASPWDKIWGIGLDAKSKEAQNESTWKGQNLLGYILTDVKKVLQDI